VSHAVSTVSTTVAKFADVLIIYAGYRQNITSSRDPREMASPENSQVSKKSSEVGGVTRYG